MCTTFNKLKKNTKKKQFEFGTDNDMATVPTQVQWYRIQWYYRRNI